MRRRFNYFTLLIFIIGNSLFNITNVDADISNFWNLPIPAQGAAPETIAKPYASLKPEKCGQCHVKQYQEWQKSFHAKATGPGLLGQLPLFDVITARSCLNCHAPRVEQQNTILSDNFTSVHGVDCASCHVRSHQRYSSRDIAVTPHGSVKSESLFKKSEFCMPCHQFGDDGILVNGTPLENTMEEWRNSRYPSQDKTCQSCHMPRGSHNFAGTHDPNMVKKGLLITAQRSKKSLVLSLYNKGAGHALPSYITPQIRVLWRGDDGHKQVLTVLQRRMNWNADTGWSERFDTRLQAHEKREIVTNIHGTLSGWVEVWVDPDADYHDRVYPAILEEMNKDSTDSKSIQLIKQAYNLSAKSTYRLLRLRCDKGDKHDCF